MQKLQINIPEGFEIGNFDMNTREVTFKAKPKCIMERIKTIDDVLKYHNIEKDDFEADYKGLPEDVKAYRLLVLIAAALNEGWTPDWDNSSEYKYNPYFKMGSSGFRSYGYGLWTTHSAVGSRLCFKTRELTVYAAEQFKDIYSNYFLIK